MTNPRRSAHAATAAPDLAQLDEARLAVHAYQLGASAPAEIQLLPLGTFGGRDGRGPYSVGDAADVAAIIALSKQLAPDGQIPIDYDHALELGGGQARAAGWITDLMAKPDGIYGTVTWTAAGEKAIADREYRFISPVFYHTKDGGVLALTSAALTNKPNLDLQSLNSRTERSTSTTQEKPSVKSLLERMRETLKLKADATDDAIVAHCSELAERESKNTIALTAICSELGVAETAELAAITAAIAAKSAHAAGTAAEPDASKFVPIAVVNDLTEQLATARKSSNASASETAVAAGVRAGKITPAMKPWALAYHAKDPKGFGEWLDKQPAILAPDASTGDAATAAAVTAAAHARTGEVTLTDDDKAICKQTGVTETDMLETKKKNLSARK